MQIQSKWLAAPLALGLVAGVAVTSTPALAVDRQDSTSDKNYAIKSAKIVSSNSLRTGSCNTIDVVVAISGPSKKGSVNVWLEDPSRYDKGMKSKWQTVKFDGTSTTKTVRFRNMEVSRSPGGSVRYQAKFMGGSAGYHTDADNSDNVVRGTWNVKSTCPKSSTRRGADGKLQKSPQYQKKQMAPRGTKTGTWR
ncbi:MAG: hypothetical protein ACPG06_01445 [Alphaproteobacteria bacterium]